VTDKRPNRLVKMEKTPTNLNRSESRHDSKSK
jgi:hypothetical protein